MNKILHLSVRTTLLAVFAFVGLSVILSGLIGHILTERIHKHEEEMALGAQTLQKGAGTMKYIVVNTQRIATNSILAEDQNMLVLAPVQSNQFYELVDEMSDTVGENETSIHYGLKNLKNNYRNFLTKVLSMSAQFVEGVETRKEKLAEVNLSAQHFIDDLNKLTDQIGDVSVQNLDEIYKYNRISFYFNL